MARITFYPTTPPMITQEGASRNDDVYKISIDMSYILEMERYVFVCTTLFREVRKTLDMHVSWMFSSLKNGQSHSSTERSTMK